MAVLRPVCLRVFANHLRSRLDSLAIEGECPGRKANLHSQDIQKRLNGLDMLIYPDLDAHVLDLLGVGVHEIERLIGFIVRVEVAVHLPALGIDHRPQRRGRDQDTLFAETEFPDKGVRSEEHTSELQSRENLVCRLLLEKKKNTRTPSSPRARISARPYSPPRNRQYRQRYHEYSPNR